MDTETIRESVIAGSWYPGHPRALRDEIERYLKDAVLDEVKGELVGLVAPHAGYMYSGATAAHAYKLLEKHRFDRVLIVAPSHRAHFQGSSIYKLGGYRTPLGVVPLEREMVDELFRQQARIGYVPNAHTQEHSLEIQLPFLQVLLGDFRLVPIVMGDQSYEHCRELADAIAAVCQGRKVLLVASSDLSHYHSSREAKLFDDALMDRVAAFDPQGLHRDIREGKCEACGGGPVTTLMLAARKLGANKAKILHYSNSGDVSGDTHRVVGYMAAAFLDNPGGNRVRTTSSSEREGVGVDLGLSADEKETLRTIAYQAIRSRCLEEPLPESSIPAGRLQESRGAFVTIHEEGRLRGCIGLIEGRGPLHETVRNMAIQAAFADPRFPQLRPNELDRIDLEISVLTPLERIKDFSLVEVGRHGLLIRKGFYSGLLLPQVASEHGWSREEFLEWTCRKACLSPDAWKSPDAEIYVFSADVF